VADLEMEGLVDEVDLAETVETTVVVLVAVEGLAEIAVDLEAADSIVALENLGKCIKQSVLIVRRNVKFLSNQRKESQFIVRTVFLTIRSFKIES
jgi:hypothetical protein